MSRVCLVNFMNVALQALFIVFLLKDGPIDVKLSYITIGVSKLVQTYLKLQKKNVWGILFFYNERVPRCLGTYGNVCGKNKTYPAAY